MKDKIKAWLYTRLFFSGYRHSIGLAHLWWFNFKDKGIGCSLCGNACGYVIRWDFIGKDYKQHYIIQCGCCGKIVYISYGLN